MSSYPMVDVVSRLYAALPDVPDPYGVVTVKESDLRAVLSQDMLVDSVKSQGAALRSLWDQMDEWQKIRREENDAHTAAVLRRDQRIQELHDQLGMSSNDQRADMVFKRWRGVMGRLARDKSGER